MGVIARAYPSLAYINYSLLSLGYVFMHYRAAFHSALMTFCRISPPLGALEHTHMQSTVMCLTKNCSIIVLSLLIDKLMLTVTEHSVYILVLFIRLREVNNANQ